MRLRTGPQKLLQMCLAVLESFVVKRAKQILPPTVWIVGPPRSGTTLLYQLLLQRYCFVYLCNFAAKYYNSPVTATRLAKGLFTRRHIHDPYNSNYGKTPQPLGASEAGEFWYRWFPRGEHVYVPSGGLALDRLKEFRAEIVALVSANDAPGLFKNTYNSMRIGPIIDAFPDACFLVLRRDPVDTAQSILRGRIEQKGSKEAWWSLPPKEIDSIRALPYCDQVVAQVYYTYKQIEEDRSRFGSNGFLDVSYEGLCAATHDTLDGVEDYLNGQGIYLQKRATVPNHFPVSKDIKIELEDYRCIQQKVSTLWT
jgi:hypothetical protein